MEGRQILLADRQDITRAGFMFLIEKYSRATYRAINDKAQLLEKLREGDADGSQRVVIVDYTLFDFNGVDDLLIISQRYPEVSWLVFSTDLDLKFVKKITLESTNIGILLKESPMAEIKEALAFTLQGRRFICQRTMEMLLTPEKKPEEEKSVLTKTEKEILIDIASGLTTREIAEKRISSFHTVNTHRKNIFRKLEVNNAHEAIKYALRAGLVDAAEYCI
ncbi:MAG: response regulator transcription factor [Prevotella sp.]|nr:response regulator transcription factor [Prevotella sp.]